MKINQLLESPRGNTMQALRLAAPSLSVACIRYMSRARCLQ